MIFSLFEMAMTRDLESDQMISLLKSKDRAALRQALTARASATKAEPTLLRHSVVVGIFKDAAKSSATGVSIPRCIYKALSLRNRYSHMRYLRLQTWSSTWLFLLSCLPNPGLFNCQRYYFLLCHSFVFKDKFIASYSEVPENPGV